jgi:putative transposase
LQGDFINWGKVIQGEYAWAFLQNHAHFLLRTGQVPLATVMRRLLTGYVVSFNRRHKRHGHLLQNRYKSIVCQEETYLQELVRYIHLNPLRAGVVPDLVALNSCLYCGHSALMGKRERPWQNVDYVLHSFGKTVRRVPGKNIFYTLRRGLSMGAVGISLEEGWFAVLAVGQKRRN